MSAHRPTLPPVYKLPSGKWSIRCQHCGHRHARPYSDDYVLCPSCRCAPGDHEPDDDNPSTCWTCGWDIPVAEQPPAVEWVECQTCRGHGMVEQQVPVAHTEGSPS